MLIHLGGEQARKLLYQVPAGRLKRPPRDTRPIDCQLIEDRIPGILGEVVPMRPELRPLVNAAMSERIPAGTTVELRGGRGRRGFCITLEVWETES